MLFVGHRCFLKALAWNRGTYCLSGWGKERKGRIYEYAHKLDNISVVKHKPTLIKNVHESNKIEHLIKSHHIIRALNTFFINCYISACQCNWVAIGTRGITCSSIYWTYCTVLTLTSDTLYRCYRYCLILILMTGMKICKCERQICISYCILIHQRDVLVY